MVWDLHQVVDLCIYDVNSFSETLNVNVQCITMSGLHVALLLNLELALLTLASHST